MLETLQAVRESGKNRQSWPTWRKERKIAVSLREMRVFRTIGET